MERKWQKAFCVPYRELIAATAERGTIRYVTLFCVRMYVICYVCDGICAYFSSEHDTKHEHHAYRKQYCFEDNIHVLTSITIPNACRWMCWPLYLCICDKTCMCAKKGSDDFIHHQKQINHKIHKFVLQFQEASEEKTLFLCMDNRIDFRSMHA